MSAPVFERNLEKILKESYRDVSTEQVDASFREFRKRRGKKIMGSFLTGTAAAAFLTACVWISVDTLRPSSQPEGVSLAGVLPVSQEEANDDKFSLDRAILVTSVTGFRRYNPNTSAKVKAGEWVMVYIEPTNFRLLHNEGRYTLHLRYDWKLYDDRMKEVRINSWRKVGSKEKEDHVGYREPIKEYHQFFKLPIPSQLTPGHYLIRITVEDVHQKKSDHRYIPARVQEPRRASKGRQDPASTKKDQEERARQLALLQKQVEDLRLKIQRLERRYTSAHPTLRAAHFEYQDLLFRIAKLRTPSKPEQARFTITYVVRPGDTLWTISKKFYRSAPTGIDLILRANKRLPKTRLKVGEKIDIPFAKVRDMPPEYQSKFRVFDGKKDR